MNELTKLDFTLFAQRIQAMLDKEHKHFLFLKERNAPQKMLTESQKMIDHLTLRHEQYLEHAEKL